MEKFIKIIQDVRLYQYLSAFVILYLLSHVIKAALS